MLYRLKNPYQHRWNGIGGKIERGETPEAAVRREVREETGLDLSDAASFYFAGIVSWNLPDSFEREGMYAFIAELPSDYQMPVLTTCSERNISWKRIEWVCQKANQMVASNLPYFLPEMFTYNIPLHYLCDYQDGVLRGVQIHSFPKDMVYL